MPMLDDHEYPRDCIAFLSGLAFDLAKGLASEFNQLLPGPTDRTQFLSRWVEVGDPLQVGDGANLSEHPKLPHHYLVAVHPDRVL